MKHFQPLNLGSRFGLLWRYDARRQPFVALLTVALLLSMLGVRIWADESPLAIVSAGVEKSEDSPFVSESYQFLPGDYVYFVFQIAGFKVKENDATEARLISLSYEVTPQDANGVALTPPVSDVIKVELNPEDKNWTPKRRASFLLPSSIAAGAFRIHLVVKDLLANTETERDFPFRIGGAHIEPSASVIVENFQFFRKESDETPLDVSAYSPGDTVFVRFEMAGFKVGPQNRYHLSYGLDVFRPDGKLFLQQPNAADLTSDSFYRAQFVPAQINITTPKDGTKGQYVIALTVRDLVGNASYSMKRAFSIE